MAKVKNKVQGKKVRDWVEERLPVFSFIKHTAEYKTPKNLNYAWNFGSLAGIALVIQILTGLFLAMQYTPQIGLAFDSVENIMRNVNYGWLMRYAHAVGASTFFAVVYIHIGRGLYYGSYKSPRELLWFIGIIIFLLMMATAFMGYVLPWGQMSFWGATVISGLFTAIPVIGDTIHTWLLGGFSVANPTLNRFFALHFLLPFLIVGVVLIHLIALHNGGSNNPTGVEIKSDKDTIPFHPYYTFKDIFGFSVYFFIYFSLVFFAPNLLGDPENYNQANPMVTPPHIVPEWYFLPFYAILRSIPDKLGGVIAMFAAIIIWFFLPWLDGSKAKSARYKPIFATLTFTIYIVFAGLGYIGAKTAEEPYITIGQILTTWYFLHFLLFIPLVSRWEKPRNVPESIDADWNRK
jgi:ubiquinol-cytochrome c reductase cytochrome b subunit